MSNILTQHIYRSNKSLQKYFASFDQALLGMEIIDNYGTKFDKTKHGSLFLSKVCSDTFDQILIFKLTDFTNPTRKN